MNKEQMLLVKISEECNEVGKTCSKAIRFGLDNFGPSQHASNLEALKDEVTDLMVAFGYLIEHIGDSGIAMTEEVGLKRRARIDKYLEVSRKLGILKE